MPRTDAAKCGTTRGYRAHLWREEEACPECKEAEAEYARSRRDGTFKRKLLKYRDRDAIRTVACPYCGAEAGDYCRSAKTGGKPVLRVCGDREHAYEAEVG